MRGLIRDDRGAWITCYALHIGRCTTYVVGLWGIVKGLKVARSRVYEAHWWNLTPPLLFHFSDWIFRWLP